MLNTGRTYVDGANRATFALRCRGGKCDAVVRLAGQRRRLSLDRGEREYLFFKVGRRSRVTLRVRLAGGKLQRLRAPLTRRGQRTCGFGNVDIVDDEVAGAR